MLLALFIKSSLLNDICVLACSLWTQKRRSHIKAHPMNGLEDKPRAQGANLRPKKLMHQNLLVLPHPVVQKPQRFCEEAFSKAIE